MELGEFAVYRINIRIPLAERVAGGQRLRQFGRLAQALEQLGGAAQDGHSLATTVSYSP